MLIWCFSGWGQPTDGLHGLFPEARHIAYSEHTPETWRDALPPETPDLILGWSLGGQMAVRAVLEMGVLPRALVLLGAPWRFVAAPEWPHGMGRATYELFRQNYATQPERTARRFAHLIAQGDAHAIRIANEQEAHFPVMADKTRWLPWLDALGAWAPEAVDALPPTLIVHGMRDGIVSAVQATQWEKNVMQSELHLWEECGHAPHLHDAERLRDLALSWGARHAR